MKRRLSLLILLLSLGFVSPVFAQQEEPELKLKVRKDFGYGGGSTIQGRFSLSVDGPDDLLKVTYLIDGKFMAEVTEEPFRYSFSTSEYELGEHRIEAIGILASGEEIRSQVRTYKFISAEEGWGVALRFLVPILVVTAGLAAIAGLGTFLLGRGKGHFELGKYGAAGGAICPACGNPYSRNLFAPNLLVGKLGRCPHCGKWAIARRASREQLLAAEAKWAEDERRGKRQPVEPDEHLRQMLEESKYEEG